MAESLKSAFLVLGFSVIITMGVMGSLLLGEVLGFIPGTALEEPSVGEQLEACERQLREAHEELDDCYGGPVYECCPH